MTSIKECVENQLWFRLAQEAVRRFDIDDSAAGVIAPLLQRILSWTVTHPKRFASVYDWSDGTWWMFIKAHLIEAGIFEPFCKGTSVTFAGVSCVPLHVFFIHLEENDTMLERLRNELPEKDRQRLARSRIFRDDIPLPRPIDSVACKIAPELSNQHRKQEP